VTLSFQPLSLSEVARRRAARTTPFLAAVAPDPALEARTDAVLVDLTADPDEAR
jgi:hypothetical protein